MRIRLLGGLLVEGDAEDVGAADFPGRQGRLAFAYLTITRGPVARDDLADVIWPDRLPKSWERDLSSLISKVRTVLTRAGLASDVIGSSGRTYELSLPADSVVDVHRSRRAVDEAEGLVRDGDHATAAQVAREAAGSLREVFLPSETGDWVEGVRAENVRYRLRALSAFADASAGAGDVALAEAAFAEAVDLDPLSESRYVRLMRAQIANGNRADALRTYERCRKLLAEELGTDPSPETQAVYHDALRLRSGSRRPQLPSALTLTDTPFVGRTGELEVLRAAWKAARNGERRVVLVAGEPGIGKTRLASELAREAYDEGDVVLYGRCSEEPVVPFEPFVEALTAYVTVADADSLRRDLGGLAPDLGRLVPGYDASSSAAAMPDPGAERHRMFEAVVRVLSTAGSCVVLVLDDLQWAARPTVLLLRHLIRRDLPVLVLATLRDTELDPAVAADLAIMERSVGVERVDLHGFDADGVGAFVSHAVGGDDERTTRLAESLHGQTRGNPFFVTEMLRELMKEGFDAATAPDPKVPRLVRETVWRQVQRLGPHAEAALPVASTIGRVFPLGVVEAVTGCDLIGVAEEAVRAGILVEDEASPGWLAFAHDIVRETVHARTSATRRVRLHLEIGEAFERCAPELVEAIAHHYASAGRAAGSERIAAYALRASERAMARVAYEDAVAYLERACDVIGDSSDASPATTCELLTALARALFASGDRPASRATALEAAKTARAAGAADSLARAAIVYYGRAAAVGVVDPTFAAISEEALAAVGPEPSPVRGQLLSASAEYRFSGEGNDEMGRALVEDALTVARATNDPQTLAMALGALIVVLSSSPDVERAEGAVNELVGLYGANPRLAGLVDPLFSRARVRLIRGDVAGADDAIHELRRVGAEHNLWSARSNVSKYDVARALLAGNFDEAEREIDRGTAEFRDLDTNVLATYFAQRVFLDLERGLCDATISMLASAGDALTVTPALRALLAVALARSGDLDTARAHFDALTANGLRSLPRDVTWTAAVALLSETCAILRDSDAARRLYDELAPFTRTVVVAAAIVGCFGAADRFLGMLLTVLGRMEEAEDHFRLATAIEERMGAAPLLARTYVWHARMLLARADGDDRQRASALFADATAIAHRLGMAELAEEAGRLAQTVPSNAPR